MKSKMLNFYKNKNGTYRIMQDSFDLVEVLNKFVKVYGHVSSEFIMEVDSKQEALEVIKANDHPILAYALQLQLNDSVYDNDDDDEFMN